MSMTKDELKEMLDERDRINDEKLEELTKANPKDRPDDNIDDGNNEEKYSRLLVIL